MTLRILQANKLRHYVISDTCSTSPKLLQRRRETLMIFVNAQCC